MHIILLEWRHKESNDVKFEIEISGGWQEFASLEDADFILFIICLFFFFMEFLVRTTGEKNT